MPGRFSDLDGEIEAVALAHVEAGIDGAVNEQETRPASGGHRGYVRRGVVVGCIMGTLVIVGVVTSSHGKPRSTSRHVGRINYAMELYDESQSGLAQDADGLPGMAPLASAVGGTSSSSTASATPTSINDLATPGQHCDKNEELLLGVCYMNCSLLTQGRYPIRTAPNICCNKMPCLSPSQVDANGFMPGTGYIVGGKGAGSYPHGPGGCAGNEESHLGMCYKKCSLLTNNEFPQRVMANTCCKASPCWNPFNLKTSGSGACSGFGIGGGLSDEEKCPHNPTAQQ